MSSSVVAVLEGGGPGVTDKIASIVSTQPGLFAELMFGLWHVEGGVRSRAADAVEKATREHPELLDPFKTELLGLMPEARPAAVRWHLAQLLPRLGLTGAERRRAIDLLRSYLNDRSSIVKTFAMDSLAELAAPDKKLHGEVIEMIRGFTKTGTPAMKARGRKLLAKLAS